MEDVSQRTRDAQGFSAQSTEKTEKCFIFYNFWYCEQFRTLYYKTLLQSLRNLDNFETKIQDSPAVICRLKEYHFHEKSFPNQMLLLPSSEEKFQKRPPIKDALQKKHDKGNSLQKGQRVIKKQSVLQSQHF